MTAASAATVDAVTMNAGNNDGAATAAVGGANAMVAAPSPQSCSRGKSVARQWGRLGTDRGRDGRRA